MGRLGGVENFNAAWMTENLEVAEATEYVVGQVKWFDAGKGFGFVVSDSGGPDILLHANVLRNYGQGSVADGSPIELRVQRTERGLQAIEILSLAPPTDADAKTLYGINVEEAASAPLAAARVKWFDKAKGFGFANEFGSTDDIFLHIEVLRRYGLADLQTGEAIAIKVVQGDRGKMAAEVHSWDNAATDNS